jgi:hypothetical protein
VELSVCFRVNNVSVWRIVWSRLVPFECEAWNSSEPEPGLLSVEPDDDDDEAFFIKVAVLPGFPRSYHLLPNSRWARPSTAKTVSFKKAVCFI